MALHPEVEASGLTSEQFDTLASVAAGMFLLEDFIDYWGDRSFDFQNPSANALGLRDERKLVKPYDIACKTFNLRHCGQFGQDLGIFQSTTSHPWFNIENEMDTLSRRGELCVFFVPPNVFSHREPDCDEMTLTGYEMYWYLTNTLTYPPTHFVWGLYDRYRLLLP